MRRREFITATAGAAVGLILRPAASVTRSPSAVSRPNVLFIMTDQQHAGISYIPSNDFSFYDQVLDMIALFGAVPERFKFSGEYVDLDSLFAMARGVQKQGFDATAMEMTKWFDTNYHYMVPEVDSKQSFALSSSKAVDQFNEAKALGITTRPVVIGPVTFLLQIGRAHV